MPEVKSVSVRLSTEGYDDARLKIEKLAVSADELGRKHPEITPQINAAKVLLEARLLRDGIKRELSGSVMAGGGGGLFSKILGSSGLGPNGGSGWFSGLDNLPMGGLPGIAAITAGIGVLLPELGGLVAGFAAATAGVAAFAAVAMPTFQKLTGDISAVHNANQSFQESALNVDTALKHSSLDAAAYNKALAAMPGNLASATRLLGDQGVRWQDLTKRQQDNVTALANNKAALTSLLPSQKTALTALLSAKKAWDDMNPAQQKAATSLNQLSNGYQKIVTALQPDVFKVFNAGLKVANNLLPALQPLAQAGATAISGLLGQVAKFTQSKGFKDWLSQFDKLAGPSITAIGTGIGKIIIAVGKLIDRFSAHDAAHAINVFFDPIVWTINTLSDIIGRLMRNWDQLSSGIARAWRDIKQWTDDGRRAVGAALNWLAGKVLGFFKNVIDGAASAFGWIPLIGPQLKSAAGSFDAFAANIQGALAGIASQASTTAAAVSRVAIGGPQPLRRASGGPASGLTLVGEMGPELLQVPAGSYVYPNTQTRAMLSGASGAATYNINVSVAPGSEREAGRAIVAAIRKFEQGSGKGWRS